MIDLPSLDPVHAAILKLSNSLSIVKTQKVSILNAAGLVLAEDIRSDRDSPALDVSAMDGFAIRLEDWHSKPLPIVGVAAAGMAPVTLPERAAIRIFTGAPVPVGADAIMVRECASVSDDQVDFNVDFDNVRQGQHIRRQGENTPANHLIIKSGTYLSASVTAAVSTFGPSSVLTYRKLNVSIINTGDELVSDELVASGKSVEAWQIRDSNGPFLAQFLRQQPWVGSIERTSVGDSQEKLLQCIVDGLSRSDVLLLTGGVSMGDYDYVPEMIRQAACHIGFHGLPIRPGKPVLGAVGPQGQLVCGLPGNPVSVAVTARRIGIPLMRKIAGLPMDEPVAWFVEAPVSPIPKIDLIHYRLCNIDPSGTCQWTPMTGSGDVVALSRSHGFIELPPKQILAKQILGESMAKRFRFYAW